MILTRYDPPGTRVLGDRWEFLITVREKAIAPATVGALLDLTGATVTMTLNHGTPKTATLANQTSDKGEATVVYLPEDTAEMANPDLTGGQYRYRVTVSFDADNIDTVADGVIKVTR